MTKITITVDENEIARLVTERIAVAMEKEYCTESREAKRGIRDGVDKAVKSYVYANKDAIIDRCVARASAELVRKGLPKLIERMESNGD